MTRPDWTRLAEQLGPQPAAYTEPETPPPRRQLRLPAPDDPRFTGPLIPDHARKEARHDQQGPRRPLPDRERQ